MYAENSCRKSGGPSGCENFKNFFLLGGEKRKGEVKSNVVGGGS